jgi:hypothetical protein
MTNYEGLEKHRFGANELRAWITGIFLGGRFSNL